LKIRIHEPMKNSLNSLFKLTLTVFLSSSAMAQLPELGSPSTINGASTTARFFGGASSDNGALGNGLFME